MGRGGRGWGGTLLAAAAPVVGKGGEGWGAWRVRIDGVEALRMWGKSPPHPLLKKKPARRGRIWYVVRMLWVVIVVGLIVLGLLYVLAEVYLPKQRGGGGKKPVALEYEACGKLLTEAEAAFYPVLVEAAKAGPEACLVMSKVRLGDLVRPKRGLDRSRGATLRNRANQKHVDFVVVRASDFGVVAAVELDDSSHQRAKVKERDGFVDGALEAAGVRVVRVKWGRGYDLAELTARIWPQFAL